MSSLRSGLGRHGLRVLSSLRSGLRCGRRLKGAVCVEPEGGCVC